MRSLLVLLPSWLPVTATPSISADPAAVSHTSAPKKLSDSDQIVCEYVKELGTRLASHKVCATRGEWAQRRQEDRMGIDRGQLLQESKGR